MNDTKITKSWLILFHNLNEIQKRYAAAVKAEELGYGGISEVSRMTGLSRNTIKKGLNEVQKISSINNSGKIRLPGGGRKALSAKNKSIITTVSKILDESTAGDPMGPLVWTSKSTRKIASEMKSNGLEVSKDTIHRLMIEMGYTLQLNRKMLSKKENPDRNEQFEYINSSVMAFMKDNLPVISVDAKKRENVGNFKNDGTCWKEKGKPKKVLTYDFRSDAEGIAIPYGTFDLQRNEGFVSIGISRDTAEFAVNSIQHWWVKYGKKHYKNAKKILICADGGGSNGSNNRLWKKCLQKFATKQGISIHVRHYPPGTSKWNKIEHRMFSYISINWRGRPLEDYETIINLIANTTTNKGLKLTAKIDKKKYKKGIKISDDEFKALNLHLDNKFPKWNYRIDPEMS